MQAAMWSSAALAAPYATPLSSCRAAEKEMLTMSPDRWATISGAARALQT